MRLLKYKILLLLISFWYINSALSQEVGRYPFKNFSHRDYLGHSQNWSMVQDHRGIIYVANNIGVLEYDGSHWRTISTNGALVRSLDVDNAGRIWVGGQDELGYLAADSNSNMSYHSLANSIGESCKPFGLVRQVYATNSGIYFSTNSCLIRIKGNTFNVFKPKTQLHRTYRVADIIFSVQPDVGLTMLSNDTLILVPGGEHFANTRIYCMLPYGKNQILIGTQSNGFFLYNTDCLKAETPSIHDPFLTPFITSNDNFFKENWVYNGVALSDGYFAIGTYRGGAAIFDKDGKVVRYINRASGLQDETVWYLNVDNQENLWLALNNGIAYTAITAPVTSWNETSGVYGVLQSVERFNNRIYISSNSGVYCLNSNVFNKINGILNLSWGMKAVTDSKGKQDLVVATGDGIYGIEKETGTPLINAKSPAFTIHQSKFHANTAYVGLYDGLGLLVKRNGQWMYEGRFEGVEGRIYSLDEDDNGILWFISRYNGVYSAKISKPTSLKIDSLNLYVNTPFEPKFDEDSQIRNVFGDIKLSTHRGLSRYSASRNAFIADSSLGVELANGSTGIRLFTCDSRNFLWFEIYKEQHSRWVERALRNEDGTFVRLNAEFSAIPRMIFYHVMVEPNGTTWFAGSDGLFRFDPNERPRGRRLPRVLIRKVITKNGTNIFNGAFQQVCFDGYYSCTGIVQQMGNAPSIEYGNNSIQFFFSSPYFEQTDRTKYSYYLEGFDRHWSEWSSSQQKEYTNLPFGEYTFHIKALNLYEVESPVVSFTFTVVRPWFYHPFAFFLYFIALVLLVLLAIILKTRVLKHSNVRLQTLVSERTKEIVSQQKWILEINEQLEQQKEELQAHRDELMVQNKNINSSLQYAVTIQQAILPEKTHIDQLFENFVIYIPKDVVSGDFYWLSHWPLKGKQSEKIFVCVVDCTGHGVPGAFMSMIGSRLLSEIVNERKISSPAQILTELDKAVNTVLHQKSSENFDGMDVAFCAIEYKPQGYIDIYFSGANRSLYYHKKNSTKMETIKGNRKSIGGNMPEIDSTFTNKRVALEPGDSIFLFTDGMPDQNNPSRKKFTTCRLNTFILANIDKPMDEIGKNLLDEFNYFKDEAPQRDDITLIGIRFPKSINSTSSL